MNLKIEVIDYKIIFHKKIPFLEGEIAINDFYEGFDLQIRWWKVEDYERQWREGLERIKIHPSSCLVSNIQDPKLGNFVEWWLLFREGKTIYIYNQWLFREKYDEKIGTNAFTPDTCYNFIGDREDLLATAREGGGISEWVVNLDD